MTKPLFKRTIDKFVNPNESKLEVFFKGGTILLHRRTEEERKNSIQQDEWDTTQDIAKADAIKLTKEPYRGLILEMKEMPEGLWVAVVAEGDQDTIDLMKKDGSWQNVGKRYISVNQEAHIGILKWLQLLQGEK